MTTRGGGAHDRHRRAAHAPESLGAVVIRFAGDSGDGMQLTGDRFTSVSAWIGNDLSTLPEFPAEIRAPAGTLAGVSAFQVHISDHDITTPGDAPNVLVAMNPAALAGELAPVEQGGTLIVNTDTFDERNLAKAGYAANPLEDGSPRGYQVVEVPMTSLTKEATAPLGVKPRDADRSKNFFALGLISLAVHPAHRRRRWSWIEQALRRERAGPRRPTGPPSWPAATSARPPSCSTTSTRSSRPTCPPGEYTQHHRQHRAGVGAGRRRPAGQPAGLPRQLPDHAGLATSSTSCPSTRTSACARSRPRTRSPPSARRSAPPSPVTSA